MNQDVKAHIMSNLKGGTGGCNHLEMKEALRCPTCQMKMIRAQAELKRLTKEYPEKFIRKEDERMTPKEEELNFKLDERIENDTDYNKHLRILAKGTREEQIREQKRELSGFYERREGNWKRRTL